MVELFDWLFKAKSLFCGINRAVEGITDVFSLRYSLQFTLEGCCTAA